MLANIKKSDNKSNFGIELFFREAWSLKIRIRIQVISYKVYIDKRMVILYEIPSKKFENISIFFFSWEIWTTSKKTEVGGLNMTYE